MTLWSSTENPFLLFSHYFSICNSTLPHTMFVVLHWQTYVEAYHYVKVWYGSWHADLSMLRTPCSAQYLLWLVRHSCKAAQRLHQPENFLWCWSGTLAINQKCKKFLCYNLLALAEILCADTADIFVQDVIPVCTASRLIGVQWKLEDELFELVWVLYKSEQLLERCKSKSNSSKALMHPNSKWEYSTIVERTQYTSNKSVISSSMHL